MDLGAWRRRVWSEFRGRGLTRGERDVLLQLSHYGVRAWPSHRTLAERARCSVRTVKRALVRGRALGLVSWCWRRVRAGWRSLQTSNLYVLVATSQMPARTECQKGRRVEFLQNSKDFKPVRSEADVSVLECIRARRERALGFATAGG